MPTPNTEQEPTPKPSVSKSDTVTMTKAQFEKLTSRLDKVETIFRKPQRVKKHFATMRLHDGKLVVAYGKTRPYRDENKDARLWLDVWTEGAEKPDQVDYLTFLNDPNQVKVQIIKQQATERVDSKGSMRAENPDPAKISGRGWNDPGQVEMEVVTVEYECDVEVLDGEHAGTKLTVPSTALNT